MHTSVSSYPEQNPRSEAAMLVLSIARTLHRAACSASLPASLPVLRRIIASDTLQGLSLPQLYQRREMVQRKHVLRTLAIEAGFASWEAYRDALRSMPAQQLQHFELSRRDAGYPNLWFSSSSEAQAYAKQHGGRALRAGRQGVVLAHTQSPQ